MSQPTSAPYAATTATIMTIPPGADLAERSVRDDALTTVEDGGIVLLSGTGFALSDAEAALVGELRAMLTTEPQVPDGRPTIIFDPARGGIKRFHFAYSRGRLVRAQVRPTARPVIEAMMARFGAWAEGVIGALLPSYGTNLDRDRITYRPNRRGDVQPLHMDSSYGFPTQGRGMLRVFSNIDPTSRPRVWQVGEPFAPVARRYVGSLRAQRSGLGAALLARLGLLGGAKTPYDRMMADLRRLVKGDKEYQREAPRRTVAFPAGSTWIALTDLVLHGAVSGQHSLDQTFYLPAAAMRDPSRSSLHMLERLTGQRLV
jgi:hypothetical protein